MIVRIATRASALALWQAHHVADLLRGQNPGLEIEIVELTTTGDRRTDVPISVIGGKGVFVKEVQAAVLDGRADLAVHSAKDLPSETPDGLIIAAVPERGDPRDVLVGCRLEELGAESVVATGSARRRVQLQAHNGEVGFAELRGNIQTRLGKASGFSAIVMAKAALDRLAIDRPDVHVLAEDVMIPQVGQGALAVECRNPQDSRDRETLALVATIDHAASRRRLETERAFLQELGGDCDLPAGAYATLVGDGECEVAGVLSALDGSGLTRLRLRGAPGPALGARLAKELRQAVPESHSE